MKNQPLPLTPTEVQILARCPLHYHFRQQSPMSGLDPAQAQLDDQVRQAIRRLHASGGPARLSLAETVQPVAQEPQAQAMLTAYYHRLTRDWPQMMVSNETIRLKISLGGVPVILSGTVDRLDKTRDGGILAILFRTEPAPLPDAASLRTDLALTVYHALVAATYPLKRPVRLQQLWLAHNQDVTIELSEEEYRRNLSLLREPVQALARGEVMARPGLHCDRCPYQHRGCPVYAHDPQAEPDDFESNDADGKISPRKWVFKI